MMPNFFVLLFLALLYSSQLKAGDIVPFSMEYCGIKLNFTVEGRNEVQKLVDKLRENKTVHARMVERADMYFPFIDDAFAKIGIPKDLKYITIQESGLKGDAVSRSNAVGFWQFKESTAKLMGLTVNGAIDERKHIFRSSIGAARYFATNYFRHGNWLYAVISYYEGGTGALNHIDLNQAEATEMVIDENLHFYAQKAIAHKIAFEDEIGKKVSPNYWLEPFSAYGGTTLNQLLEITGLEEIEFRKYNLWLKSTTLPESGEYSYYVPRRGAVYTRIPDPFLHLFAQEVFPQKKTPSVYNKPIKVRADEDAKKEFIDNNKETSNITTETIKTEKQVSIDTPLTTTTNNNVYQRQKKQVSKVSENPLTFSNNEPTSKTEDKKPTKVVIENNDNIWSVNETFTNQSATAKVDKQDTTKLKTFTLNEDTHPAEKEGVYYDPVHKIKTIKKKSPEIPQKQANDTVYINNTKTINDGEKSNQITGNGYKFATKPIEKTIKPKVVTQGEPQAPKHPSNPYYGYTGYKFATKPIKARDPHDTLVKPNSPPAKESLYEEKILEEEPLYNTEFVLITPTYGIIDASVEHGVPVRSLCQFNRLKPDQLPAVGTVLYLLHPQHANAYIVREEGEKLEDIAFLTFRDVEKLREYNSIGIDEHYLKKGQKIHLRTKRPDYEKRVILKSKNPLVVPATIPVITGFPSPSVVAPTFFIYHAVENETPAAIAEKLNVTVEDIIRWNHLNGDEEFRAGYKIKYAKKEQTSNN